MVQLLAMAGLSSVREDPTELQQVTGTRTKKPRSSVSRPRIPSVEEVATKEEPEWTILSPAQNLAAALNDPVCREYDLFTRTWGSYFISTAPLPASDLPKIELGDFLRYLKETSAGRKSHRAIARQLKKEEQEPSSPMSVRPLVHQLQQDGRTYDLGAIPRIFMQADFSLSDPPTFEEVIPVSQLFPQPKKKGAGHPSHNTQQTSKLLHEKLTHYLDIIEVHLTYQVSQRSDVFFSTLSSQQELQTYIMQVRHEVMELRHKIRETDRDLTHQPLHLVHLCSLRSRYALVHQKLKLIATVQQTQPTIQLLLSTSDFVGALDLITTTQEVLQQELQGVHSLRHLSSQLAELERAIERMMEADFVHFAQEDIKHRLQNGRGVLAILDDNDNDTEERLVSVVYGLLRQGKLRFLTALREALLAYLKNQVKEILKNYLQIPLLEEEGVEAPSLADIMRGIKFDAWVTMLDHVFNSMQLHLSATQSSIQVIARVCEAAAGRPTPSSDHATTTEAQKKTPNLESPLNSFGQNALSDDYMYGTKDMRGKDLMVSFEENTAVQEAEDRLEQLLLEDELSDTRIGTLTSAELMQVAFDEMGDHSSGRRGLEEEEESMTRLEQLSRRGSRMQVTTTHLERQYPEEMGRSLDVKERERSGSGTLDMREREKLDGIASIDDSAVISPLECRQLLMECHEVMAAACDLVHTRCAKILAIRAKAGLLENLVSTDFVTLVRLIERFVSNSAQITGRHCPNLRSSLLTQARKFLEHFHETRRERLSLLLDGERWKQADVPGEIQSLVQRLEAGIPLHTESLRVPTPEGQPSQPPSKYLLVHGHNFAVVGIVLLLIKMITEYCQCADDLPMLVTEVMSKLVDTLKHFNVRTCQLVLGAGAVEAVGLKTITARHLALVSRCLQTMMLLLPDIRKHFQLRLAVKQHILLTHFDQVTEDFTRHCRQINTKVMTIMDELILKQLTKWEAKSPIPSPCFKTLIKQVIKLHENLIDILPQPQLEAMFRAIEQIFINRLQMQLVKLGVTNNGSTQHGIVNSELTHFKGALSSLENISSFGNTLFDVWTVNR